MATSTKTAQTEDLLVQGGLADPLQIAAARKRMTRVGGTLPGSLVRMGLAPESRVLEALSRGYAVPTVGRDRLGAPHEDALTKLPFEQAFAHRALPLGITQKNGHACLEIALADPAMRARVAQHGALAGMELKVFVAPEREIERAIESAYGRKAPPFRPEAVSLAEVHRVLGHLPDDPAAQVAALSKRGRDQESGVSGPVVETPFSHEPPRDEDAPIALSESASELMMQDPEEEEALYEREQFEEERSRERFHVPVPEPLGAEPQPVDPDLEFEVSVETADGDLGGDVMELANDGSLEPAGEAAEQEIEPGRKKEKDEAPQAGPSKEIVALRVLIELLEQKGVLTREEFMNALKKAAE